MVLPFELELCRNGKDVSQKQPRDNRAGQRLASVKILADRFESRLVQHPPRLPVMNEHEGSPVGLAPLGLYPAIPPRLYLVPSFPEFITGHCHPLSFRVFGFRTRQLSYTILIGSRQRKSEEFQENSEDFSVPSNLLSC